MGRGKSTRTSLNKVKVQRSALHNKKVRTLKSASAIHGSTPLFVPNAARGSSRKATTKKGIKKHLRRQAHALRERTSAREAESKATVASAAAATVVTASSMVE